MILGIALGVTLAVGGLNLGLFQLKGNSLMVPAVIIGVIYVPYVAKPVRGQVRSLRNVIWTLIVFIPLIVANAILTEAGLSYLGAGVQDPNPSWGTMISDGIPRLSTAIHLTLVPGIMLVLAVLGVNVFGDGVRDALDPRATVRIQHGW